MKLIIFTTILSILLFNFIDTDLRTKELVPPSVSSFDQALSADEILNATETNITLHIDGSLTSSDKLSVPVGTTLTWVNDDSQDHVIMSRTGVFDSGRIEPGERFSYTFTDLGSYKYVCDSDPNIESEVFVN